MTVRNPMIFLIASWLILLIGLPFGIVPLGVSTVLPHTVPGDNEQMLEWFRVILMTFFGRTLEQEKNGL